MMKKTKLNARNDQGAADHATATQAAALQKKNDQAAALREAEKNAARKKEEREAAAKREAARIILEREKDENKWNLAEIYAAEKAEEARAEKDLLAQLDEDQAILEQERTRRARTRRG